MGEVHKRQHSELDKKGKLNLQFSCDDWESRLEEIDESLKRVSIVLSASDSACRCFTNLKQEHDELSKMLSTGGCILSKEGRLQASIESNHFLPAIFGSTKKLGMG